MLGAIAGDIIGAPYEWRRIKTEDFPLFKHESTFTDDTVLTIAVADALMNRKEIATTLKEYTRAYPNAGYGHKFEQWAKSTSRKPYGSYGNGSAMRVSAAAYVATSLSEALTLAKKSAEVTHNHPEGIRGARAVAASIYMARHGKRKMEIERYISREFRYDLEGKTVAEIRPSYGFDSSCQGSVPQAIIAFLDSNGFEDAIRKAVSLGGDSDTLAAMAGAIAEAYYHDISEEIKREIKKRLDGKLWNILNKFMKKYY